MTSHTSRNYEIRQNSGIYKLMLVAVMNINQFCERFQVNRSSSCCLVQRQSYKRQQL